MANKMIKNKSKCGECFSDKTRFMKPTIIKKVVSNTIKQTC